MDGNVIGTIAMNKKRIYGLEIFRILAAVGVLCYHYFFIGVIQGFYSKDVFIEFAFWGEFGVDIFFLISGFVIFLSTTNRTPLQFIGSRAKRIYPIFLLCSLFTLITGLMMPDTLPFDLLYRWLNSLTFFNDLWGMPPLSSIYWTLMVEVKFYILIAIVMKIEKSMGERARGYRYQLLIGWLIVSLLNSYWWNNDLLAIILNTKYAGHFSFGILCYLMYRGENTKQQLCIAILSIWLIFLNFINYTNWIRGIYTGVTYNDVEIFLAVLTLVVCFWLSVYVDSISIKIQRLIICLSTLSYPFFLIHADLGYFIRTQYYLNINNIPLEVIRLINEKIIMVIAILTSFAMACFSNRLVKKISEHVSP